MKNFVVVGGRSGIGRQLSLKLEAAGHAVFSLSRQTAPDSLGIRHIVFDAINDPWPKNDLPDCIDGLAYCPGSITLKSIRSLKTDDVLEDLQVNLIGAINVVKSALPLLKKVSEAQLLFFSTVAVHVGMPFHSSVAAAKGAVEGLTRSLAAELSPEIRVNAIAPSIVDTPLAQRLLSSPERIAAAQERHPVKQIGSADQVASLASALLQGELNWATGQIFHLDGGISAIRK